MRGIDAYELIGIVMKEEFLCYELVRKGASPHVYDLMRDPKRSEEVISLLETVKKIRDRGLRDSLRTSKLTPLSRPEKIYEIKNYCGVAREVSCIATETDGRTTIVLLFDFRGHQGTDAIPRSTLDKAMRLGKEALSLLDELRKEGKL